MSRDRLPIEEALEVGSYWEWPGGTSVDHGTVLDRPFAAFGKWWVAMDGYTHDQPRLVQATRLTDHGTRLR